MRTPLHLSIIATLGLLWPAPASAVQGGAYRTWADPDVPTHRARTVAGQARLSEGPAWKAFQRRHGDGWKVRWDEADGSARQVWGPGIPVDEGALSRHDRLWEIAEDLLFDEGLPVGVGRAELRRGGIDRSGGVTTVTWQRTHRGLPVRDTFVSLRFKAGRFVVAQLASSPGIDIDVTPSRSPEQGRRDALAAADRSGRATASGAQLVVLPVPTRAQVRHHLAWEVVVTAPGPSRAIVHVDAHTGDWLRHDEQLRFLDGTVLVEVDDRRPFDGLTTRPLSLGEVIGEQGAADADFEGRVQLPGDGPQRVAFEPDSDFFDVDPAGVGEINWSGDLAEGGTVVGVPPDGDDATRRRARAQADAHVFSHEVRDYCLGIDPEFQWAPTRVPVLVNIDSFNGDQVRCNAWFDGRGMNFVRQGRGCHNTARLQDVVYHEYGHGFHGFSIVEGAGGWGDGSLGEGLADYLSATMNDDPELAAGFFTGGREPLRRLDSGLRWPADIDDDPHVTGLIIAGALWDAREALIDARGRDEGVRIADRLFWHIAMRASDIEDAYVEALLADDDNGDLDDGTPNQCLIDAAFDAHGLGPGVGPLAPQWELDHLPLGPAIAEGATPLVRAAVSLSNPECADGGLGEVTLHWTLDDGGPESFRPVPMAEATLGFEAELPAASRGLLRYFLVVTDEHGDEVARLPEGSVTDPWYAAWVGDAEVQFATDFEADDGGFVHELVLGDPDIEGADDWQWGPPGGLSGDPAEATSGDRVWGNDLAPGQSWNGAYAPEVANMLRSPAISVGADAPSVHVQFQRWLTVEDGFFDRAELVVNGTTVWSNHASEAHSEDAPADRHHRDAEWLFRSYDVTDLVDGGVVRIEWRLASDAGLELGGWNIDDVRVVTGTAPRGDDPIGDGFIAQGAGCTCATASGGPGGLLALAVLGALRRRR